MPKYKTRRPNSRELMGLPEYYYSTTSSPLRAWYNMIDRISRERMNQGLNPVYYLNEQYTDSEKLRFVERLDDRQNEQTSLRQLELFD